MAMIKAEGLEIAVLRGEDTETAHVLGLFSRDHTLRHLQIETTRDLEEQPPAVDGSYWANLSGRHLAHYLALHCGGCWGNGNRTVVLRYAVQGGRFLGWHP